MLRTQQTQWHRLERWRRRNRPAGIRRTVTGLWLVTDAALTAEVFGPGHANYRPQNPFFFVGGGPFSSGGGHLPPDVRRGGLRDLMHALAAHRPLDEATLLARCLPADGRLPLQGWGTRFLRHAYADVLARDRDPLVGEVIDQFVAGNLVRRGIRGHRLQFGIVRMRHLSARLADELEQARRSPVDSAAPDLIDVVGALPGLAPIDRAEVYLRLVTAMLFATGVALEWSVLLAARQPRPWELVVNEAHARATVLEAQRLFPTAWGPVRTSVRDHRLGGRLIEEGDDLVVLNYLIHRNPTYWPAPGTFRPERMLDPAPAGTFQPFAAGPTACPARSFALNTLTRATSAIVRAFDIAVDLRPRSAPMARFLLAPPAGELRLTARTG
jgi:hypothetical protein